MIDRTKYEEVLQEALRNCKIRSLTDEENIKIREELSAGTNEFLLEERKRNVESEQELRTIILD